MHNERLRQGVLSPAVLRMWPDSQNSHSRSLGTDTSGHKKHTDRTLHKIAVYARSLGLLTPQDSIVTREHAADTATPKQLRLLHVRQPITDAVISRCRHGLLAANCTMLRQRLSPHMRLSAPVNGTCCCACEGVVYNGMAAIPLHGASAACLPPSSIPDGTPVWLAAVVVAMGGNRSAKLAVPAGWAHRNGCASSCAAVGLADGDFCGMTEHLQ